MLAAAASIAAVWAAAGAAPSPAAGQKDWAYNGGDLGDHYSSLSQINRQTVSGLKEVWRVETGVGGVQTNPLVIGRTLFGFTPDLRPFAVDAATGKALWRFDPGIPGTQPSRGFTYWSDGTSKRLFAGIMNRLYALDPVTGRPIAGFGENGFVDLRRNLRADPEGQATYLTAPGVIYRDMIIIGFRTSEAKPAAPGAIRAYDVRTGALRWSFNTIPHRGEAGYETWPDGREHEQGAANDWAGLAVDAKRGIVYAPTGSAVTDFYGADRKGDNLFANSLLALDAKTGRRVWHFQAVHHDLWDRDFSSPPLLLTVKSGGRMVDAVAQATKQGMLFLFDRATGKPLFPVQERPMPASDTPGEAASPTQPFTTSPAPFARQHLTADLLTQRTPAAHAWALDQFKAFISAGQFKPLTVDRQTVVFPGFDGGAEWGGSAADPRTGVLYINSNDLAWTGGLASAATPGVGPGATLYQNQCSACHGPDRAGFPPAFPSIIERAAAMSDEQIVATIANGKGRMPAFPMVTRSADLKAMLTFLRTGHEQAVPERSDRQEVTSVGGQQAAYRFTGYRKFLDPDGYPAVKPPWGTLSAIDLNTGAYLWKIPLGEYPELAMLGMNDTGSENYGGPIVTAGGLVIIAATNFDDRLRVFDSRTGKLVWQTTLPYAGNATPATYMIDGRQYLVIATSNGRNPKGKQGSAYVAYALPR